jgi:hypothetical protein
MTPPPAADLEKATIHRVTLRLIPFLFIPFIFDWMDRDTAAIGEAG